MRDSETYGAIFEVGWEDHARKCIRRLGQKRFGPASEANLEQLARVTDLARLNRMLDRVYEARNWQDLLDTP